MDDFNGDASALESYLYEQSLLLEPKGADKPPYFVSYTLCFYL